MHQVVDLAPGTDRNPIARELAARVRTNLASSESTARRFRSMRGSVLMIADDLGAALTLRFDFGRLTIHDGRVGVPDVTLRASAAGLDNFGRIAEAVGGLSELTGSGRRTAARRAVSVVGELRASGIKVYGLIRHPRLVLRLATLLRV